MTLIRCVSGVRIYMSCRETTPTNSSITCTAVHAPRNDMYILIPYTHLFRVIYIYSHTLTHLRRAAVHIIGDFVGVGVSKHSCEVRGCGCVYNPWTDVASTTSWVWVCLQYLRRCCIYNMRVYGVATISRLLKITDLFCKRAL